MEFSEPYPGKEGKWWVEVTFPDGYQRAIVFENRQEAEDFRVNPKSPSRVQWLRELEGKDLPPLAGTVPLSLDPPAYPPAPLPQVPVMSPPYPSPFDSDEEEREALEQENELNRLRIENAELREGVKTGKMPLRLQARDMVTGAIGASVWAIASKFIGC